MPQKIEIPNTNLHYVGKHADISGRVLPRTASVQEAEGAGQHLESVRQRIFNTFKSHEEGINTKRIDSYFEDLGLQTLPHLVLLPEDIPELTKMLEQGYGITPSQSESGPARGASFADIGFCYVVKNPDLEAVQGSAVTEAALVHEKAHTADKNGIVSGITMPKTSTAAKGWTVLSRLTKKSRQGAHKTTDISLPEPVRRGFTVGEPESRQGDFYDEGYAELIRMDYMEKMMGLSHGLTGRTGMLKIAPDVEIPAAYAIPTRTGMTIVGPSVAGYGMELLASRYPDICSALIEARSGTDGLRKFAKTVQAIKPGLYTQLRRLNNTPDGFLDGVRHIQDALKSETPTKRPTT